MFHLMPRAKQFLIMCGLMVVLGVVPIFALTFVPAEKGQMKSETISGEAAGWFLAARLADHPAARAAYGRVAAKYRAEGRSRSIAVVRRYYEGGSQSALRQIAEFIVPTLEARRRDDAYIAYEDYSGYFEQYYAGTISYFDGSGEVGLAVTFNKDPDYLENDSSSQIMMCSGACQSGPETTTFANLRRRFTQAVYPSLDAAAMDNPGYWTRWARCVVGSCSTAAVACLIANVWNGEALWLPCFTSWCGGAEVGCLIWAIWS